MPFRLAKGLNLQIMLNFYGMNPSHEFYRRHLPHWQPSGAVFFVTFRLKGSLPMTVIKTLQERREREKQNLLNLPLDLRNSQDNLDEKRSFGRWDAALDKSDYGPRWLIQPKIAEIVQEALHYRDGIEFDLFAYCIMSNHVHTVFGKLESCSDLPLSKIMQSLKRHIARKANLLLDRQGAFWQDESYDHVIRDLGEFERIISYVLENPVKAGLVLDWEKWPWSYYKM